MLNIISLIKKKTTRPYFLIVANIFLLIAFIFTSLHYVGIYYGNVVMQMAWIASVPSLLLAFLPARIKPKEILSNINKQQLLLIMFVAILYFISHLWNFSTAPWNTYGLFDDAAWDIYFAKKYIDSGAPFQAAFFDEVGYISREVVFHYYILLFFKLFGYNLLVFNISLIILGFITVLFSVLIVQTLFKNIYLSLVISFVMNFFPLHYNHVFMGHRYAIAAPLMMVSLYFLYTGFKKVSFFRTSLSALFAALCWGSAIMGKQYLLGLLLTVFLLLITGRKLRYKQKYLTLFAVWIFAFIVTGLPLIVYVMFNPNLYFIREQGLFRDFYQLYRVGGIEAIKPYFTQFYEIFFASHTFRRQFLPDNYIIPIFYYLFLLPGLVIAFIKKRFEIVLLSLIPAFSAFVSGPYDFRVLLSVGPWVVAMAYSLNYLFSLATSYKSLKGMGLVLLGLIAVSPGLFPSTAYTWKVSQNPEHLYLLPHRDVAVSRMVQDLVAGDKYPSVKMKWNEFKRPTDLSDVSYDTMVCPYSAYAIIHLYLQDFDDKKILALCDQGIQLLKTPEEIFLNNLTAVLKHTDSGKDLKLVWEVSDKTRLTLNMFDEFKKYGNSQSITGTIDNKSFELYVLSINNQNIEKMQSDLEIYK